MVSMAPSFPVLNDAFLNFCVPLEVFLERRSSSAQTLRMSSFSWRQSLLCWGRTRSIEQNNFRSSSVLYCQGTPLRTRLPTTLATASAEGSSRGCWSPLLSGEFKASWEHPRLYSAAILRPMKSACKKE